MAGKEKKKKTTLPDGSEKWLSGPSPDLDLIHFRDRITLIAFDSNATTNPLVQKARTAFKKELVARGGVVSFIEIPAEDNINGPDDLIAIRGDAAMLDALDHASGEADTLVHLIRNNDGSAKSSLANAITILRDSTEWRGVLGYNEFTLRVVARKPTPWGKVEGTDWTDVDDIRATDWLQHQVLDVQSRTVSEAVQTVASENPFHPVKEYLNALRWDGAKRLDDWLTTYLGAEQTEFSKAVGPRWMISAVARIFEPGCRADHTLLLEGAQGIRKSTALRTLAGPAWFSDHISDLDSKDSRLELHGKWIIELAELSSIKRSLNEKVKSFLSAVADNFRPPYGRITVHVPRSNVFAGTVNDATPLTDETGNRRFWPVRCGKIDIEAIERDRDQLWAEVVFRYKTGEPWWLETDELNALANVEQDERYEVGVWDEIILRWLDDPVQRNGLDGVPIDPFDSNRYRVTVTDVLIHGVGRSIEQCTRVHRNEVSRCLAHAGWTASRKRIGEAGSRSRPRFYERPR